MVRNIRGIYSENQRIVKILDAEIIGATKQFSKAMGMMGSACPLMKGKDVASCEARAKNLRLLLPDGFLKHKTIITYRSMVPKIQKAMDADSQTERRGEKQLAAIAYEVASLYNADSSN